MNEDFQDILTALPESGARLLVVGAHALAVHGVPRATGDLQLWVEPTPENARRVWQALLRFGAPVEALGVTPADFTEPDMVVQIGIPPRRIDLLTGLTGVDFESAWSDRVTSRLGELEAPVLGRKTLLRNKRATGRARDRADLEALGEAAD